jgi:hypothetical protein
MTLAHRPPIDPATRRRLLAYPPATPVQLPAPVEPSQVTSGTDRFRCPKLHAVITAADCQKRYDAAHVDVGGRPNADRMNARVVANHTGACRGCEVGPQLIHPKLVVKKKRRTGAGS